MEALHLSQSELARRVGISQSAVHKLASGTAYGSKHLHRIARELGTTPAFLSGETDDPDEGAPPPAPASQHQVVTMSVLLPSEAALTRMLQGLLGSFENWRAMDEAELARELAMLLPTGLGRLRGPLREEVLVENGMRPEPAEAHAISELAPQRVRRT